MRKNLYLGLISLLCLFSLMACSDDDNYTPVVALKEVKITPKGQAISISLINENINAIELNNASDSIAFDVPTESIQQSVIDVTTTIGVGIEVYYKGELVQNGNTIVDATQPIQLEVRGYNQSHWYTLHVYQEQEFREGEEPRLKSSDMRKAGINANAYDYDVIVFKNRFYAIVSSLRDESTSDYQLYASDNGIIWEEVQYNCVDVNNAPVTIGGRGARLAIANNRMYVLGGGRYDGSDKYGYGPEMSGTSAKVSNWRSFSTDDGINFKVDTIGIKYVQSGSTLKRRIPTPTSYPNVTSYKNKLYYSGGFSSQFFGMWQSTNQFYASEDGKNWDSVSPAGGVVLSNVKECAYFVFKGKLWLLGGFTNFISKSNIRSLIYSTEDGINWTLETDSPAFGKLSGMKVAATDDVVYLFGGEYFSEDGKRVLSDKIYRSTDAVHWEVVPVISDKYTPRRASRVVVKDGVAYIFGGMQNPSSDNYCYPVDADLLFDTYVMTLQ